MQIFLYLDIDYIFCQFFIISETGCGNQHESLFCNAVFLILFLQDCAEHRQPSKATASGCNHPMAWNTTLTAQDAATNPAKSAHSAAGIA